MQTDFVYFCLEELLLALILCFSLCPICCAFVCTCLGETWTAGSTPAPPDHDGPEHGRPNHSGPDHCGPDHYCADHSGPYCTCRLRFVAQFLEILPKDELDCPHCRPMPKRNILNGVRGRVFFLFAVRLCRVYLQQRLPWRRIRQLLERLGMLCTRLPQRQRRPSMRRKKRMRESRRRGNVLLLF